MKGRELVNLLISDNGIWLDADVVDWAGDDVEVTLNGNRIRIADDSEHKEEKVDTKEPEKYDRFKLLREKLMDSNVELEDYVAFSDPCYVKAVIGTSSDNRLIYDYDIMVDELIEDYNMDEEEATDFISYNNSFIQKDGPIILYKLWT